MEAITAAAHTPAFGKLPPERGRKGIFSNRARRGVQFTASQPGHVRHAAFKGLRETSAEEVVQGRLADEAIASKKTAHAKKSRNAPPGSEEGAMASESSPRRTMDRTRYHQPWSRDTHFVWDRSNRCGEPYARVGAARGRHRDNVLPEARGRRRQRSIKRHKVKEGEERYTRGLEDCYLVQAGVLETRWARPSRVERCNRVVFDLDRATKYVGRGHKAARELASGW